MAKKKGNLMPHEVGPDTRWIKVIPLKGRARMELRLVVDSIITDKVIRSRRA